MKWSAAAIRVDQQQEKSAARIRGWGEKALQEGAGRGAGQDTGGLRVRARTEDGLAIRPRRADDLLELTRARHHNHRVQRPKVQHEKRFECREPAEDGGIAPRRLADHGFAALVISQPQRLQERRE